MIGYIVHLLWVPCQSSRMRLVVTDGVFSMDGDVAPLTGICDLAERYGAMVFIDECHATGFLGPRGRWVKCERTAPLSVLHLSNLTLKSDIVHQVFYFL